MKYSKYGDVTDALLMKHVKPSDHVAADGYIHALFNQIGYRDPEPTQLLKELAIIHVSYKRAHYSFMSVGDIFYKKYIQYEEKLREKTDKVMRYYSKREGVLETLASTLKTKGEESKAKDEKILLLKREIESLNKNMGYLKKRITELEGGKK